MKAAASFAKQRAPALHSHRIHRCGRCVLATIFLYSAGAKLWDLDAFAEVIADYGLVFDAAVFATAVGVVLAEVAIGVALLFGTRGSVAAGTAMLGLFAAVLSYGLWLGLDIDCGCFGIGAAGSGRTSLAAALRGDLVLLLLCVYLLAWRPPVESAAKTGNE